MDSFEGLVSLSRVELRPVLLRQSSKVLFVTFCCEGLRLGGLGSHSQVVCVVLS